mmetsp:Transcript_123831/g.263896  ORF Transcript_123831/g.263896 Transcript_123831/m.263896 type:complete len:233 (-) Transcript_123831:61-759(-)
MSSAEAKFFQDGYSHRTRAYDDLLDAKKEFGGQLNFGAYRQGRDKQYLGVNGINYYAKPWGNDSSNVQAVLNGPAYWKRVYYRENIAARFQREDDEKAARNAAAAEVEAKISGNPAPKKSASEGSLRRLPEEPVKEAADGYADIKANMKPFVEKQGKPRIRAMGVGERLTFFNSLDNKYHMKAGGKNLAWNVSKETHRSTKNELRWICSNYFRTDTQAVLAGSGSEPALQTK